MSEPSGPSGPLEAALVQLFSPDELQALGEALHFAVIAAREERAFRLDVEDIEGIEWTPDKRAAYKAHLAAFLAKSRGESDA